MNMDALAAKVTARRASAGLIAKDGVACATDAEKAYHDFRHDMKARADWGSLPADLESRLISLKAATTEPKKGGA